MKFIYGKNDWNSMERGQENCYLITNGLGGYSSLSMIGSNARNDHALFMACVKAPNHRYHMVSGLDEVLQQGENKITLSSQEYVGFTKNKTGFTYLQQFQYDKAPVWSYQVDGIEIKKTIVMRHGENTLGIRYEIDNRMDQEVTFKLTPQLQFVPKGECIAPSQRFDTMQHFIESNGHKLYFKTNARIEVYDTEYVDDIYYSYDARDGRNAIGKTAHNHKLMLTIAGHRSEVLELIYSMKPVNCGFEQLYCEEVTRQESLLDRSRIKEPVGQQLVLSADQFVVNRESTNGKTIMAGYPFFADWGRDTMIALVGCCIST
ncbi:MAG: glycogen debranching enzyme, partial [Herbinix sp.]|nr:glycogen debranching enzyme [Herbinix sp.]